MSTTTEHAELLARVKSMGTLEVIPISQLNFDKAYQRDLRQQFAQKLANEWKTTALGFPVVSRRPSGKLYVINGQHRIAAALMNGLSDMVCLVISGLSEKEEADIRIAGNVHLAETSLETFRAKIAAKYPDALDIVKIVERYGTHINETPNKATGINAISALERLYELDRGASLSATFDLIQETWGKVEGDVATSNMLKAIAWLIEAHADDENYNRARMVEKLRETGPAALHMKMYAQRAVMAGSQWVNLYRAMIEVYNERLSEGARLKWRTRGWTKSKRAGGGWDNE